MKHFETEISKDHRFLMDNKEFKAHIQQMKPGRYMMVLMSLENNKSTREWMNLYRAVLREMSNDTGYKAEEMHEFCKTDVLSKIGVTTTTDLDEISWKVYFEYLKEWAFDKFNFII